MEVSILLLDLTFHWSLMGVSSQLCQLRSSGDLLLSSEAGLGFSALCLCWVRRPSCSSVGIFRLLLWVKLLQRLVRVTSKRVEGRAGVQVSFGFQGVQSSL